MTIAFVAGATGYTGRSVVKELRARGVATVAHVRPDSLDRERWAERFEACDATVDFTAWERGAFENRFRALAPTVVFGLLGTTKKRARAASDSAIADTYEAVDYGLSALLVRACLCAPSAPRFVYLSSLGASPDSSSAYLRARGRVEDDLRASGLPFLIARPSFISGSDREELRPMERTASVVSDAVLSGLRWVGGRRAADRYQSLTGEALARGLVGFALDANPPEEVDAAAIRARAGSHRAGQTI